MTLRVRESDDALPAGLVIFTVDGRAQFGWQNPETGEFFAEADGSCITDAIAAVAWHGDVMH